MTNNEQWQWYQEFVDEKCQFNWANPRIRAEKRFCDEYLQFLDHKYFYGLVFERVDNGVIFTDVTPKIITKNERANTHEVRFDGQLFPRIFIRMDEMRKGRENLRELVAHEGIHTYMDLLGFDEEDPHGPIWSSLAQEIANNEGITFRFADRLIPPQRGQKRKRL